MVVLICAAVGMRAPLFAVDVNETLVVELLKDVIKEKMPDKIKCSAARLHLFLAEKGGHWLQDDAPAALELVEGKIHEDVQAMIDEGEMAVTWSIGDWPKKKWMTGDYVPTTTDPCAGEVPDDSDPNLLKYQRKHCNQAMLGFSTTDLEQNAESGSAWLNGSTRLESTEIATMESSQQGTLDSLDPARIPHLRFALW
ncbi:hypothetical protein Poli38472_003205 [Pythium oligandrum]|uniref:Crinkler effector protein N-terminal domain-containing protein n=1 Tax=Pythium oligandrum TaxID=41045 RepID=A0A8K1C6D8_PYTOL|nr:hypothetical protein Poli38472_003205 [Pythium oligandrum]|eukprot:TMW57280.1 hypothetical protein Poli38472_003205 [Pythium oligandrum]